MAAFAGMLFGIDIGVIAQAKDFIAKDLAIDDQMLSWVVGSLMGGATFGTLFSGHLTRKQGRKNTLIISAFFFVIGAIGCTSAWSGPSLIAARIILGLSIGIASFTAPLYLSEVAPKSIRGTMISMYQLLITIGILASFLINTYIRNITFTGAEDQIAENFLISDISVGWRLMLGITVVPSVIFFIGLFFLPRSPRWLISVGRNEEALSVLKKIRGSEEEAVQESREIINTISNQDKSNGFAMFIQNKNFRKTVFLGITLQLLQQLSGINIIMYFGPELIKAAGYTSEFHTNLGTIAIGVTNVLATIIAIAFVDKWGRKPILIAGYSIMAVAMLAVAGFIHFGYSLAAIIAVLVFIVAFAFSAGPVVWVLCSEIQPLKGRDFGITCSTGANWLSNMLIAASFLPIMGLLGSDMTMCVYAAFSFIAIFLILAFVPETKGVSLEHLEGNLMKGVKLKDIGK
jgi:SP family galactose:H+ symporter-like MFS transporter